MTPIAVKKKKNKNNQNKNNTPSLPKVGSNILCDGSERALFELMYFLHLLYTRALDITAVHAKKKTALELGCHPFLSPEPIVFFGNVVNKAEWVGLGTRMGCHPIDPSKPLFSLVPITCTTYCFQG